MRARLIVAELQMLAKPSAQLAYEASLTEAGHAPSELVSRFCDDLFHPRDLALAGELTGDELKGLAHLYGLMVEVGHARHATVVSMLKDPMWRKAVALANELLGRLSRPAGNPTRAHSHLTQRRRADLPADRQPGQIPGSFQPASRG